MAVAMVAGGAPPATASDKLFGAGSPSGTRSSETAMGLDQSLNRIGQTVSGPGKYHLRSNEKCVTITHV